MIDTHLEIMMKVIALTLSFFFFKKYSCKERDKIVGVGVQGIRGGLLSIIL